jgi:hypothetical protein
VRIYKVKVFARFQRKEGITDETLVKAVRNADAGLIEADLGGGLIKQRVARPGAGKRAGYRTVIAFRRRERAVFLYGFAKSARANIDTDELATLRRRGAGLLNAPETALEPMIVDDELIEVDYGEDE